MFPSNSNHGSYNNDQVYFNEQSIFHRPFLHDITTNSKQDQDPLSFFHLSSPFFHYESALEDDRNVFLQQNLDLLLNHQQPLRADHNTNLSEIFVNMADSSQNDVMGSTKDSCKKSHNVGSQQIPRKRASRRDRHSKINTAKGLRDRRMRLSLEVAHNFFGLQDMLGYDKASKTVEWLLIQAKQEIRKLEKGLPKLNYSCASVGARSASSTSECTEVASGFNEAAIAESNISKAKPSIKGKKIRQSSRKVTLGPLTRDLRVKARARARERTTEKMMTRENNKSKLSDVAKNNDLNQLGSWSSFETGEESGTHSRDMNHSLQVLPEIEEPSSHQHEHIGNQEAIVDDSLVSMGKWSPYSSFFNCLHNIGTPQEHQLTDLQFFKP
ncbi:hypothetical protein ACOSQ2_026232 [Xanthoceras sorbifolium]|uniref:Uncharacterized protein n=1 Tax=Xanthoceras sorbifolium TaxID=99658 RepID=A0ABQ8H5U7_9ROSI|nr:hypothetical protein JRO89_XS13G0011400 [Xanthoceras sorbifolium]